LAIAVLCTTAVPRAADTPDAWITTKTKLALMTTEGIHTSALNVDTVKGVVTLHGKVETEAEKAKAADVAGRIDGTKQVKNLLQVVPKSQRDAVERSDDAIKKSVEAAFKANRRVNASGIGVASVDKGVVLLSGKTKSLEAHLESVQVASAVRGVKRVSTEVEVVPAS
jgi:osmotically-inducible protein OsmY